MKKSLILLVATLTALWGCQKDMSSAVNPKNGESGSLARFTLAGNTLYIVDHKSLSYYDLSNPADPKPGGKTDIGVGIETIFPYGNHLFIGAKDGMYIFDKADPLKPVQVGTFMHIQSCDPVVVQDRYAYVTLRGGSECRSGNSLSTLDVVDISELTSPRLVRSHTLSSPFGLGVYGKKLFVCEGDAGLKEFNLEAPDNPILKETHTDIPAYDVIIRNDHQLILTGKKGLYQFTYQENQPGLTLRSHISVK